MLNFIYFNIILLIAGFLAVLIFSVGLMVCHAPMALFSKSENPPKVLVLPFLGIVGIYQVYFWGFWSAFCVAMTIRFTQKPEVIWDWLYWVTGFLEATSVIGWLTHKERQLSQSLAEVRDVEKGAMFYSLIAVVAFLVFAFIPSLMLWPYGWALTPLGLAYDGLTIPVTQGEAPPKEYVDHQYQFAFQFPADWQFEKNPPPGEAGEVRAIVRPPTKPMRVMATVSHIGTTMTKHQFESSPNRDAGVDAMIEFSVEQIYKKTSRNIGAERMIVSEKRVQPSDAGIMFYLSTAHIKGSITMLMAGIHILPFEKSYMITFTMVTPVDRMATKDNEIITRVFNSFHILGERPIK